MARVCLLSMIPVVEATIRLRLTSEVFPPSSGQDLVLNEMALFHAGYVQWVGRSEHYMDI
jgi:hypothetical protein